MRLTLTLIIFFVLLIGVVHSEGFHRFKPGEIVSSDVFNENFQQLQDAIFGVSSAEELLGTWICTGVRTVGPSETGEIDGYWVGLEDTLTFSKNTDKYFITSGTFGSASPTIQVSVRQGVFIVPQPWSTSRDLLIGTAKSIDKFHIRIQTNNSWDVRILNCAKSNSPTNPPETLVAKLTTDKKVSLSWSQSGNWDQTVIERSESFPMDNGCIQLPGSYGVVATISSPERSYLDESVNNLGCYNKSYWYRVYSVKNGVKSMGSNIEKVEMWK